MSDDAAAARRAREGRYEGHTPAPWNDEYGFIVDGEDRLIAQMGEPFDSSDRGNADRELVAHAPELLDRLNALEAENDELRQLAAFLHSCVLGKESLSAEEGERIARALAPAPKVKP